MLMWLRSGRGRHLAAEARCGCSARTVQTRLKDDAELAEGHKHALIPTRAAADLAGCVRGGEEESVSPCVRHGGRVGRGRGGVNGLRRHASTTASQLLLLHPPSSSSSFASTSPLCYSLCLSLNPAIASSQPAHDSHLYTLCILKKIKWFLLFCFPLPLKDDHVAEVKCKKALKEIIL